MGRDKQSTHLILGRDPGTQTEFFILGRDTQTYATGQGHTEYTSDNGQRHTEYTSDTGQRHRYTDRVFLYWAETNGHTLLGRDTQSTHLIMGRGTQNTHLILGRDKGTQTEYRILGSNTVHRQSI